MLSHLHWSCVIERMSKSPSGYASLRVASMRKPKGEIELERFRVCRADQPNQLFTPSRRVAENLFQRDLEIQFFPGNVAT